MGMCACLTAAAWALLAVPLAGQSAPPPGEGRAADAVLHDMSRHGHVPRDNPHLRLSPARPAGAADSVRAAELVSRIRLELSRFRDVDVARTAGYEQFLPDVVLPVYHFTNRRYGLEAAIGFDPTRPTSLLYRKNPDGSFTLTGVMYTAPARVPDATLDARVPLGIARWHQHINWCLPKKGAEARWLETRAGKPLFGPESAIAGREACEAVAGRFMARVFGWMVHVNAFESDDPRVIWGDHH